MNLWCLTVLQIFWQFKYSLAPPDNIEVSMSDGSVFRNLLTISFIVQKLGFSATRIANNSFPKDRILVGSPSTLQQCPMPHSLRDFWKMTYTIMPQSIASRPRSVGSMWSPYAGRLLVCSLLSPHRIYASHRTRTAMGSISDNS